MGYPYNQLPDGEQVLIRQHSHWKVLIMPVLIATLILSAGIYVTTLTSKIPDPNIAFIARLVVMALILAGVARFALVPWLIWKTTHFVVTNEKVMYRRGILTKTGTDIPLSRIASVSYEHNLNDRLFGCGSLTIESMSEEPLTFTDIPRVGEIHTVLYQAVNGNLEYLTTVND